MKHSPHSADTTPARSRSLSPRCHPNSITPTDVSDMVNHMLDTFTNAQKQLLTNLHEDFKRVMIHTTSQLTADFLTHIDQLTTRTNNLDHSLTNH